MYMKHITLVCRVPSILQDYRQNDVVEPDGVRKAPTVHCPGVSRTTQVFLLALCSLPIYSTAVDVYVGVGKKMGLFSRHHMAWATW